MILTDVLQHVPSREDAEDILLEVFLAALESETLLSLGEKQQMAWLRRVAHNKCVDYYRRGTRRPAVPLETAAAILYEDENRAPEQVLNLKKTIGNNVFTIQTVYADNNRVILTYTVTSSVSGNAQPVGQKFIMANFILTMQNGITLSQMGDAGSFNSKLGYYDYVASFDTAQVPANTNTLNLHLQATLYSGMGRHQLGGFSSGFSVPLHAGRVMTWNQTVTVDGIAITLQRVVVSPSQTRLYVMSPKLQLGDPQHDPYTLAVGNWNNNTDGFDSESLITQEGNVGSFTGVRLIANTPLFNQHSEWTFKITSGAVIGGSGTWIFHFTVPN